MSYQERNIRPQQAAARLAELGYGKKTGNRVATALDQSSLQLLGNGETRKIMGGDLSAVSQAMGEFPLKGADAATIGNFNTRLVAATEAMLLVDLEQKSQTAKGEKTPLERESYIEGIGALDLHHFLPAMQDLALTTDQPDQVIRTVFGGTKKMPARGLGYLTQGGVMLEALHRRGLPLPQMQFVFAHRISAAVNDLDPQIAEEQAQLMAKVGKEFVNTFFPQVARQIVFMETIGINESNEAKDVAETLKHAYREKVPIELKGKMNTKGENHGGANNSDTYATAHFLVHDRYIPGLLVPMFEEQAAEVMPSTITTIGGVQERDFYRLRMALGEAVSDLKNVKTLFYSSRQGVPPYLMANNGRIDLALEDYLQTGDYPYNGGLGARDRIDPNSPFDPSALLDYKNLALVTHNRGGIERFLDAVRRTR